ncbi:transcriptional regulator, IclR family [Marinobacter daqiaonensis]|uniref:Transcriptional regulator, IclR family n=1 Tax=Marinobacter daqiaonensis TaxID=650891 RepID=A0A1I6IBI1_9GAMM|nr:IclR family transcriptional regulator C-terminal domain-containing protein [Marinobacter daqiaonensis]SFR64097.1 transcriptional regulator, IclR family [Marinobacter daqiaonensis]
MPTSGDVPIPSRKSSGGSTTLSKACLLLRTVATVFPTGGSLSRIAREVGMNTATAHRLLTGLAGEGLLTFDPYAKTYHIGFDLLRMAESAQEVAPDLQLRHALQPVLARIAARTEDYTYLSIRANRDAVCIDVAEGSYPVTANTLVAGARRPLGVGAAAMALLAALPEEEARRMVELNASRYPRYSGITRNEVEQWLTRARQDGYSVNEGRIVPEVSAVGLAFQAPGSGHYAAISVASVASRMNEGRRERVLEILRDEIDRWASGGS